MPKPTQSAHQPNSTGARDVAYHLHPYTDLARHRETGPHVIVRGDGVRVIDEEGKAYIEGMSGLWCAALGFSEKRLAAAAKRQMETLPFYHSFTGRVPNVIVDLAEKLIGMAPVPMSKVLFCNSGSEANDTAIKLVRQFNNLGDRPEKKKIIARKGGYHGVTMGAGSLTGLAHTHSGFDLPIPNILHTTRPDYFLEGQPGETEDDFATRCAEDLENMILDEGPSTIAAFFAEPLMGAGGAVPPPVGYFAKIQEVLDKYDVLMVADEVICGFGRTGQMWGSQTFGIQPDIITSAKALSSGYAPISAVIISAPIAEALIGTTEKYGIFGHGFTYSGHPLGAAVALETLRVYEEMDIVARVGELAPRFQAALRSFGGSPIVGNVHGVGLVGGLQLVKNKETREFFDAKSRVGIHVIECAQAHGLITRNLGDVIAFAPPLIISEAEIDEMFEKFAPALMETENWVADGCPQQ
ncbi:MAG: aminotransferase class III-fold pyridoxal phosphate-dependent enzyme [Rhodospirillales bacterium]|nr:aminotransferase class III-fold pyridoxal phosphate-dependent enzyme [Rhodospirillales bacterium]